MMESRAVLFVDDEEKVLRSLKRGLLDEPYETFFAESGKEALDILEREEVHVIVTDMRMPEMSGLELLEIVKERYPRIIRMVLSGYTQITPLLEAINRGEIFRFITKPWKLEEEFKTVVRQAIDYYDLQRERDNLVAELSQYNFELEEQVRRRTEQLLTITQQAEVGKCASQVVNNLKTPLESILGFLELISDSVPEESGACDKLVQYTDQALSAAMEMREIIVDTLQHARSSVVEGAERVDVNEVIREELTFFELNPFFKSKVTRDIGLAEDLPRIAGQSIHFKQIVDNLLTNALDAMDTGNGKHLFVNTYGRDNDIVIDIRDTGGGIAPENLDRIFSPDFTTKPVGKGTGLGLASVKEMVESYGGRIEVESTEGRGSKFSIVVPISRGYADGLDEKALGKESLNVEELQNSGC